MSDPLMPAGIKIREKEWVFRCGRCGWRGIGTVILESLIFNNKARFGIICCPWCRTVMESDYEI